MDEFLDPLLSTSSWTNISSPENSSWLGSDASQTTVTDSLQTYRQDEQEQNFTGCMTPSSQMLRGMNFHETITHNGNTSRFAIDDLKCGLNGSFYSFENQLQQEMSIRSSTLHQPENGILDQSLSLPRVTENARAERQFGVGLGSMGNNSSEPSGVSQRSETSLLWASSLSGAPCLGINQINFQQFGLHGEFVKSDMDIFGKRCASGELLRSSISPVPGNGQKELHKISSTTSAIELNVEQNNHLKSNDQPSQYSKGNSAEHNVNSGTTTRIQPPQGSTNFHGSVPKPRVRARRGQATDPHSIAERLRREKISERMKNLQELVPSANKTDKASMLDEIIEYVKFLQLQVKVLSMSRVGAAGAVVPLITDIKAENAVSLLISTPTGVEGTDSCDSQENLPFEQEVAKLMESDVTTAIQLLQSKGLCLMPTALADAISIRKSSLAATPSGEKNGENSLVGSRSNNLTPKEKDMKK